MPSLLSAFVGKDLIDNYDQLSAISVESNKIDPNGFNVIVTREEVQDKVSLEVIFKLAGSIKPYDGKIVMPNNLFVRIVRTVRVPVTGVYDG